MFRKLLVASAVLAAVLVPIGVAAASTVDDAPVAADDSIETVTPPVQQVNPNCDGTCDGAGPGAGPRDGNGPLHEGPRDGSGNRFGQGGGRGNGQGAAAPHGVGIGARDGTGNGLRNPDDGLACDGTRRHAPNTADSSS